MPAAQEIRRHFQGRAPAVLGIYRALLTAARKFGPVREDPKQTSIHLTRRTAFAGVATRRDAVLLTLKAPADVRSPRIVKHERASANRWHLQIRLTTPKQVDRQLKGWLRRAYDLAG
jgi:hypothetical protein